MPTMRLPFPAACVDPAFRKCADEAVRTPELVDNFNRLYGASLGKSAKPSEADLRAFSKFVHDCIYLRLPDDAIEALRA